jgi:hypothetical protein
MRNESEKQELARLYRLLENEKDWTVYQEIKDYFHTLYTRSQLFFGLITITLTITGFSGPSIAASNVFSRVFLGLGISLVLLSAITFAMGPLRIAWIIQIRDESLEEVFTKALQRKNNRTFYYKISVLILTAGLICYVASLVAFLILGH